MLPVPLRDRTGYDAALVDTGDAAAVSKRDQAIETVRIFVPAFVHKKYAQAATGLFVKVGKQP